MDDKFLNPYDHKNTEDRIYKLWEDSGFFNPDNCIKAGVCKEREERFSMVLPPPNVTGQLHAGHALMITIEDIMVRFNRMLGKKTLWLPGTDHAAIATQSKVEKILAKERVKKHDLGREEFLKKVEEFAQESHDIIVEQTKKMGASLDWSREAFTLDETRQKAVYTAFKTMYDGGLIYRKHRVVNWDPKGQTVISDDEVIHEEKKAKFYTFKYSKDFPIAISTTRPETKVGDTAVAVNPKDKRYKNFIGKIFNVNFCGTDLEIKIIADNSVDMDFGTGALGVTPAHSMEDYELSIKYKLPLKQVINEYAKMDLGNPNLDGKKTTEAREIIVDWLKENNLLEKEEGIEQNISISERTGAVIEPLPKLQWFIDVNKEFKFPHSNSKLAKAGENISLKELMSHAVKSKQITILPNRFNKIYFHWVENLRDWCISRQIWYGHRIPVWYDKNEKIYTQSKKHIIFARHGESELNLEKIYAGQIDTPLTKNGRKQALETLKHLKDKKIEKIFSSPLSRSKETAEIIGNKLGIHVEILNDLKEISFGDLEGTKSKDKLGIWQKMFSQKTGESSKDLLERAQRAWKTILHNESENILIISHNNFIAAMFAQKSDINDEKSLIQYRQNWWMENTELKEINLLVNPHGQNLRQDEDTLDTWFSSGLWTFSTLGWPEQTEDFKNYHPTDMLETAYDILPIWVAKMILMTTYILGDIPFKEVYIHGLVRDSQGRKLSKSLGNVIDPIEIIEDYGADALRMALIVGVGPGQDSNFSPDKAKAYKKFTNKLWNVTRFILSETEEIEYKPNFKTWTFNEKIWIKKQKALIKEITKEMEEYKFHIVAEKLYHYVWHTFADEIIEEEKKYLGPIKGSSKKSEPSRRQFLLHSLKTMLILLHPFMPFITEEIWQTTKFGDKPLIITKWPEQI